MNTPLQVARAAAQLMPGWSARHHRRLCQNGAVLIHTDGRRISVLPADRETHIIVAVIYPTTSLYLTDFHKPTAQFRHDRPAAALVRAITDKLLPVYNETYPKAVQAAKASLRQADKDAALAQRIVDAVPGAKITRTEPSPWVEYRPGRGTGASSIESARVKILTDLHIAEFKYIDAEALEAVMAAYGDVVRRRASRADAQA